MTMPMGYKPPKVQPAAKTQWAGEHAIFHKQYKKGIIRKHILSDALITNYKVCLTNYSDKGEVIYSNCVPLTDIDAIVTTNNHRTGESYHYGRTFGSAYYGSANWYGISNWESRQTADICFVKNGVPIIIFKDVQSASGVVRLAREARKYLMKQ